MTNALGTGQYAVTTMKPGKKYKLRLINTSVDNHFILSLDNHVFTVIAADFTAIEPYNTTSIFIAIGQRYDVVINADQEIGNYWFRAQVPVVTPDCGRNANNGNIMSIFHYKGANLTNPTTTGWNYTQRCSDENIVPYWTTDIPEQSLDASEVLGSSIQISQTASGGTQVNWALDTSPIYVDWSNPTLQSIYQGNDSFPDNLKIIELPPEGEVSHIHARRAFGKFQSTDNNIVGLLDRPRSLRQPRQHLHPASHPPPRPRLLHPRLWHRHVLVRHQHPQLRQSTPSRHRHASGCRLAGCCVRGRQSRCLAHALSYRLALG
jgi:hypothetical protein